MTPSVGSFTSATPGSSNRRARTARLPEAGAWYRQNNGCLIRTPTDASWLDPIECQFTPVKEFVIANCDPVSHEERAIALRCCAEYRNRYARKER